MPLHQSVAPVPVDAAPHPLAGLEVVAGNPVDDVPVLVVERLGHRRPADAPGVADLSPAPGVERGAVQDDLVALHRDDVCLELEDVSVVSEYLIRHGIA